MKLRTPAFAVMDPTPERTLVQDAAITVARFRKARKLADVLAGAGATADTVSNLNTASWRMAETVAGVSQASVVTRALVAEILRDREAR